MGVGLGAEQGARVERHAVHQRALEQTFVALDGLGLDPDRKPALRQPEANAVPAIMDSASASPYFPRIRFFITISFETLNKNNHAIYNT